MTQLQFSLAEGEKRKSEGMARAAAKRFDALTVAKWVAKQLGQTQGSVSADEVYSKLGGETLTCLGPAAGSIFKGPEWEFTGQWIKSTRPSNHARYIRQWRLK